MASENDEPIEQIMQFFSYAHLPPDLQEVSKVFADAANEVLRLTPRSAERTVALRKLLEAKDAAVRAKLAKPVPWRDRASGVVAEHSELPPHTGEKP